MLLSLEREREKGLPRKRQSTPNRCHSRVSEHGFRWLRPPVKPHVFSAVLRHIVQGPPLLFTQLARRPPARESEASKAKSSLRGYERWLIEHRCASTETRTSSSKSAPEGLQGFRLGRFFAPTKLTSRKERQSRRKERGNLQAPRSLFNYDLVTPKQAPRQVVRSRVARRHIGKPSVPRCPSK